MGFLGIRISRFVPALWRLAVTAAAVLLLSSLSSSSLSTGAVAPFVNTPAEEKHLDYLLHVVGDAPAGPLPKGIAAVVHNAALEIERYIRETNMEHCEAFTVAFGNGHFENISMNWILHSEALNISCRILVAYDGLSELLEPRGIPTFKIDDVHGIGGAAGAASIVTRLYFARYVFVYATLMHNYSVFLTDVDVIPCEDPWVYLRRHHRKTSFDIAGGHGAYPQANAFKRFTNLTIGSLNAGFTCFRPTEFTKDLLRGIVGQHAESKEFNDQWFLNAHLLPHFMASTTTFVEDEELSYVVTNDKGNSMVLLSRSLYPVGGQSWKEDVVSTFCNNFQLSTSKVNRVQQGRTPFNYSKPIVVHPTMVHRPHSKVNRLKEMGVWLVPPPVKVAVHGNSTMTHGVSAQNIKIMYVPAAVDLARFRGIGSQCPHIQQMCQLPDLVKCNNDGNHYRCTMLDQKELEQGMDPQHLALMHQHEDHAPANMRTKAAVHSGHYVPRDHKSVAGVAAAAASAAAAAATTKKRVNESHR
jgi:hypothetical protein